MKTLLLILALVWAIFAVQTPFSVIDANYEWSVEIPAVSSGALTAGATTLPDTITGTGDSAVLVNNYHFPTGYSYELVRGPNGGTLTTGDSIVTRCDFLDNNKTYLFSIYVDTIVAAATAGHNILLPVNRVAYTYYVKIVQKSLAALSTRIFTTPAPIWVNKRRAVSTGKMWQ